MPTTTFSTVVRRRLGRRLRAHRADRLLDDVGTAMKERDPGGRWSTSKISRLENGTNKPSSSDVRRLLDYYDVADEDRPAMMALCREAQQLGWYHEYNDVLPEGFGAFVDLEQHATLINTWEESRIPGLLQTETYARCQLRSGLISDEEEIDRRIEARMARQEIFTRAPCPPRMRFVFGEAAIHQQVGCAEVMHRQLAQLLDISDRLTVSLGVVPFSAGPHAAMVGFTLFEFDAEEDPPTGYVELLTGSVYVERSDSVAMYRAAFENASAAALSPAESARLIEAKMKEYR